MSKRPTAGSSTLRGSVRRPSPLPNDPLEQARRFAADARDIARDEKRRLPGYDADTEEITQTGQQQRVVIENHTHVHQHSQPDVEVETSVEIGPLKAKGLPKWVTVSVAAVGIVIAAVTAIASHFAAKGH